MRSVETLRHVPWTCLWGRFGEPMPPPPDTSSRCFVFWTCAHPEGEGFQLTRDSCDSCRLWRPVAGVQKHEENGEVAAGAAGCGVR
jgi:hypothetical protein